MLRLIMVVLLLCSGAFFIPISASAAGLPMMYEITPRLQSNELLANWIDQSLAENPKGNAVIKGSECTTPMHFLAAIQEYHPEADLKDVAKLPAYIRRLRPSVRSGSDVYQQSRILRDSSGCSLDLSGWNRSFRDGELAWFDPNSGRAVLAGSCSNVIGNLVVEEVEKEELPPLPEPREITPVVTPPSIECLDKLLCNRDGDETEEPSSSSPPDDGDEPTPPEDNTPPDDGGPGNPGNNKSVGNAGEAPPNGKGEGFGDGERGKSDTRGKGRN